MVGQVPHVQTVRQRGGECVGVVRGRVRVEREEREDIGSQAGDDYQDWDEERDRRMEDKRAVAEVRGRDAGVKLARDNWIQERISKAELERRESVKLMEMLRTAKMMRKPKGTQVIEVVGGARSKVNVEKEGVEEGSDVGDGSKKGRIVGASSRPLNVPFHANPVSVVGHNVGVRQSGVGERRGVERGIEEEQTNSGKVGVEMERRALEMRRREGQKQLVKLVSPLGQLDSTEEVSCLSTIIEESEIISPSDTVDLARVKDRLTAEDSKESSVSPFPETNIERRKMVETDMTSVKQLMARVKMQGKVLEKSETHFMTVEGRPGGEASKHHMTSNPYKIDEQFVKRILEFSSSSALSSSALSPSPPSKGNHLSPKAHPLSKTSSPPSKVPLHPFKATLPPSKATLPPSKATLPPSKATIPPSKAPLPTASFSPPPPRQPKQPHLRYYIEKLLSLRQEDVQDLSVSSSTSDREVERQNKAKSVTTSSLSLASISCSVKQSRSEDSHLHSSQAIQSLYHSTRQQLLNKLSGVTARHSSVQQLDWSSFEISSGGGEGGDSSSGTVTSIHLSGTEFETW